MNKYKDKIDGHELELRQRLGLTPDLVGVVPGLTYPNSADENGGRARKNEQ